MRNFKKNKGFTLIELLVVVAIIGTLSSVVLSSLNVTRAKGRDAARLSDLRQITTALELYAGDHNGSYPVFSTCENDASWSNFGTSLSPYIKTLPKDPSSKYKYCFYHNGTNKAYIAFYTENSMPNIGNASQVSWSSFYSAYLHTKYVLGY